MTEEEFKTGKKSSNPKDALGVRKVPAHVVPAAVVMEVGLAMLEGGRKYGSHNFRVIGVLASTYYDAARRHVDAWWEGQDLDPDSGLSHVTKAIASLVVLRDAMMTGACTDDRPPKLPDTWLPELNQKAAAIIDRWPDSVAPHTALGEAEKRFNPDYGARIEESVLTETTCPREMLEPETRVGPNEGMMKVDGVWVMDHNPPQSDPNAIDMRKAPGS